VNVSAGCLRAIHSERATAVRESYRRRDSRAATATATTATRNPNPAAPTELADSVAVAVAVVVDAALTRPATARTATSVTNGRTGLRDDPVIK
jgi:hypothetical protein